MSNKSNFKEYMQRRQIMSYLDRTYRGPKESRFQSENEDDIDKRQARLRLKRTLRKKKLRRRKKRWEKRGIPIPYWAYEYAKFYRACDSDDSSSESQKKYYGGQKYRWRQEVIRYFTKVFLCAYPEDKQHLSPSMIMLNWDYDCRWRRNTGYLCKHRVTTCHILECQINAGLDGYPMEEQPEIPINSYAEYYG